MIVNLGVGLKPSSPVNGPNEKVVDKDEDGNNNMEDGDDAEDDYGALALLDTVVEEREERLSNDDVGEILSIIRDCLQEKEK